MIEDQLERFAPLFQPTSWGARDRWAIKPFFTNLDTSVYAVLIPSPEIFGALCSRASRAAGDLRSVFLREFLEPLLDPKREDGDDDMVLRRKQAESAKLEELIAFLHRYGWQEFLANPRARAFYAKWLAQYGDDSIAQMAGTHLVYWGISQVTLKHLEDQRIGLAPIEKSTRYVDFGEKINGQYRYYTDPTLRELGLERDYRRAMDGLFETYGALVPTLQTWLRDRFPQEQETAIRAKSFDVLRGLLPVSTLSQVAFFGNGQAFEYLVSRSAKHPLGEIRWAARRAYEELFKVTPSFLRRLETDIAQEYQQYLAERKGRLRKIAKELLSETTASSAASPSVRLIEYDPQGELKVITGMLYDTRGAHSSWEETFEAVRRMTDGERRGIVAEYFRGRGQRWQKVGRALENTFMRFEMVMDIGAYRDLHRHRMLTQQRQLFSCRHGFGIPGEIVEAGYEQEYRAAILRVEEVFSKIEQHDQELAQYAVTLAHRVRFQQWQNLRAFFWEAELRTIPEGHPDYRHIEQQKFQLLRNAFPLLGDFALVNMDEYDFARRGQDQRIAAKEREFERLRGSEDALK